MPGAAAGLLEREDELARLRTLAASAAAGRGTAVIIEGPPGIGKSALLAASAEIACDTGLEMLAARGGELERALAFGIARELLARRVDRAAPALRERLTTGAAGAALPALGLAGGELPPDAAAVPFGLTWIVADLAEEQPLALLVDDAHWCDAESAAWLAHLARRVDDIGALLVLAMRSPSGVAALDEIDAPRLRPRSLSQPAVATIVRGFYASDAEDAFIDACHQRAGGNPFHTHALLEAAALEEVPATAQGADVLERIAPEAVQRAVTGIARRVGAAAWELARACAILGDGAEMRHAAAVAGMDVGEAERAADVLASENLLAPRRPLQFLHPVVRSTVREGVPPGERAALHRRAADVFLQEPDGGRLAAAHLLEVGPAADAAVVRTLAEAATAALLEGAPGQAARLAERAIAEPPQPGRRGELLALLGRARFAAGTGGALEVLVEAAALTERPAERADLLATAGWAILWEARTPGAIDEIEQRIATLHDPDARMRARAAVAAASRLTGAPRRIAPPLVEAAEALAGATVAERELLIAAAQAAVAEGGFTAARVGALLDRVVDDPARTPLFWIAAQTLVAIGRSADALAPLDRALAAARREGHQLVLQSLLTARVLANMRLGDFRSAEVDARVLWRISQDVSPGSPPWAAALGWLLQVLAWRGMLDEGARLVKTHGPFDRGALYIHDVLRHCAGVLALERGDLEAAAAAQLSFERAVVERGMDNAGWLPHRPWAVEALVGLGRHREALPLAEKELRLARELEAPGTLGFALRTIGLAQGGREGRELIEHGIPLLQASGELDRLARALVDLGRSLRLERRRSDAREPLRKALALTERTGAEALARRAFSELQATGAKPRRRALSGPDALTPNELRIAELVVEGLSNREIAQRLFVSRKTVEGHLGRVYAKLGIRGRGELERALPGRT